MEILISIKQKYAKGIYRGTKKYELRKVSPNIIIGTKCYIYEPLPIGMITGQFLYAGEIVLDKNLFWKKFHYELGITLEEYLEYYEKYQNVHAWIVKKPIRFGTPYNPKELGQKAPRSYIIISKY